MTIFVERVVGFVELLQRLPKEDEECCGGGSHQQRRGGVDFCDGDAAETRPRRRHLLHAAASGKNSHF